MNLKLNFLTTVNTTFADSQTLRHICQEAIHLGNNHLIQLHSVSPNKSNKSIFPYILAFFKCITHK